MGKFGSRLDVRSLGVWASTDVIRGWRGLEREDTVDRRAPSWAQARALAPSNESRAKSQRPCAQCLGKTRARGWMGLWLAVPTRTTG